MAARRLGEPAGYTMTGIFLNELRFFNRALRHRDGAARMETAAFWRVERAGHIALEDDALALQLGVGNGNGGH